MALVDWLTRSRIQDNCVERKQRHLLVIRFKLVALKIEIPCILRFISSTRVLGFWYCYELSNVIILGEWDEGTLKVWRWCSCCTRLLQLHMLQSWYHLKTMFMMLGQCRYMTNKIGWNMIKWGLNICWIVWGGGSLFFSFGWIVPIHWIMERVWL